MSDSRVETDGWVRGEEDGHQNLSGEETVSVFVAKD